MAGPGNIVIKIGADAGQAVRELSTVDKSLGDTMTHSEKMSAGLQKAALPAAAALGAIGFAAVDAAKAAAEDAQAQKILANTLKNATGATDKQVASTEDWISSISRATGVADDELRPALGTLVRSTHDVSKAQELMQNALDISAATGKDLNSVTDALAKGYAGQTTALTRLVPGISDAARASKDFDTIMQEVNANTKGAAADAASTAAGQFQILKVQAAELKESLGAALLPVLEALAPILLKVADFAAKNTTAIKILVGVVAALSAGILVANAALKAYKAAQVLIAVATKAWTAAQWLLNAALSANPLGLVIAAVAALAAGLVIAYKKSETFRAVVTGAMNAVKGAVDAVGRAFAWLWQQAKNAFDWIVGHWKLALFAFGPIGAAVYVIVQNFDKLKAAAQAAFDYIRGAVSAVAGAIQAVIDKVKDLVAWFGKIHVPKIDLPGPFTVATGSSSSSRGAAAYMGGTTVNVYGTVDPDGTARAIARTLKARDRRIGYVYRTTAY